MSNIYPLMPNFNEKINIGNGFVKMISTIDDRNNGIFKIEVIGGEKNVDFYINDMIIVDLKLAWIDERVFDKFIRNKIEKQNWNLEKNKKYRKCIATDGCVKDFNDKINFLEIDDNFNIMEDLALNINIELIDPYFNWNYFYFEIDPRIDGQRESINSGIIHRYKQRFARGKGFVELDVHGGECGLRVENSGFEYFTENNDINSADSFEVDPRKYIVTDVCGGRHKSGKYSIKGGWAYFSIVE